MPQRSTAQTAQDWINRLQDTPRIDAYGPIATRFLYSLRLIALHDRANRDPVPELAARLGSVVVASKALVLAKAIGASWPENVHVSRFCCPLLTHDEVTIGTMLDAAVGLDVDSFEAVLSGLVRRERIDHLWECAMGLVTADSAGV